MSGAGLLAAVAALLAAAAVRELPLERLAAGLGRRAQVPALLPRKLLGAVLGGAAALLAAPAAPGRTAWLVALGLPVAGFLAPDVIRERQARRRHRRLVSALPDALDLLAVAAASGRGPAAGIEQLARGGEGPLAEELRLTVARSPAASLSVPRSTRCAGAFPGASWRRWWRRSSARGGSARL